MNRNPVSVEVTFTDIGVDLTWSVTDASEESMVVRSATVGQSVTLPPGDTIALSYEEAPDWHWRAVA